MQQIFLMQILDFSSVFAIVKFKSETESLSQKFSKLLSSEILT